MEARIRDLNAADNECAVDEDAVSQAAGGETHEVSFDLFESGTIWTQVASTQVHCEAWRRGDNPRSEEELKFAAAAGGADGAHAVAGPPVAPVECIDLVCDTDAANDALDAHSQPCTQEDTAGEPWWKKGKTAPLLDQFDESRRFWYMAQAGVYDQSHHVHDAQGIRIEDLDAETLPFASVAANGAPVARLLHPMGNATTPLRPGAAPPRAALTLAGTVNSPLAPAIARAGGAAAAAAAMQTPKRKTWESTWARKEVNETPGSDRGTPSAASSACKKARGGRAATPQSAARNTSSSKRGTPRSRLAQ